MMKVLLITGAIMLLGCAMNPEDKKNENTNKQAKTSTDYLFDPHHKTKDPYDINFDLDAKKKLLIIKIDLESGSYYLSPNTVGTFKGLLKIVLPENDFISIKGKLTDNPKALNEINPWGNERVNIIRQNTIHTQHYELKTEDDFSIQAIVEFVIEPKCTLEKIPVTIFRKDGQLSFVRSCP